jgi:3-oxoacyl-[acyl-carrier protein] reductase
MRRLKDKVAVITGGSKGIGKAIAAALGLEGCRVVITARHDTDLEKASEELTRLDIDVLSVKTDVRKWENVQDLVTNVEIKLGAPQILVNNAGIGRFGEVANMSEEDFRDVLETNLFGVFYCTRGFLPGMISKKEGHIVNISSLAGKNNFAGGAAYCASKHGLISFAECLMLEVRQHNIKVSTICPGSVQTEFSPGSMEKMWALTPEDVAKVVVDVVTSSSGSLASLVEMRPLHPPKR